MVKILIPTDLSDLSRIAADYAIKFANKLDTPVTLLHFVKVVAPVRAKLQKQLKALETDLIVRTQQDMITAMDPVVRQAQLSEPLNFQVAIGSSFSETVISEARRLQTG